MEQITYKYMPDRRQADVQIARLEERIKNLDEKIEDRTDTILKELKDMKENIIPRLERVEIQKLGATDFVTFRGDIEARTRFIEKYLWMALGVLAVIQFIGFAYLFTHT